MPFYKHCCPSLITMEDHTDACLSRQAESEPVGIPSTRRCRCGHPFNLHRINPEIGGRNECWALNDNQLIAKWCQCRQFSARRAASSEPGQGGVE